MLNCCAIRKLSHQLRTTWAQQCCSSSAAAALPQCHLYKRVRGTNFWSTMSARMLLILQALQLLCPAAAMQGSYTPIPHLVNIPASASTSLWRTFHTANLKNWPKPFFPFSPLVFIWTIPCIFSPYYWISGLCPPLLFILLLPATVFLLSPLPPADTSMYLFYAVLVPFPFLVLVGLYCIKHNTDSFFVDICGMRYGNTLFHWKFSSKDYPSWAKWLFPLFQINHARKEIFHASLLPLIFQGAPLNENPFFCVTERDTNTSYLV